MYHRIMDHVTSGPPSITIDYGDLRPFALPQTTAKPFRLLDLPDDALNKIIHILVASYRSSRLSLVLTCSRLHTLTVASYTQIAKVYAEEFDPVAAVLFEPTADWQLLRDWMPRFLSRTSQIWQLLQLSEEARKYHQSPPKTDVPLNSDLHCFFRLGLYLISLLHFQHNPVLDGLQIENFIDHLPAAGLLLLRATSMMMTSIFVHQYQDRRVFTHEVRHISDMEMTSWAFMKLLLTSGLRWPSFRLDHWEEIELVRYGLNRAKSHYDPLVTELSAIIRVMDYHEQLAEKLSMRERLKRARYGLRVSERIAAEYPADVNLLCKDWKTVDLLLDKIWDWIGERNDLEVLMELKAATGLPYA